MGKHVLGMATLHPVPNLVCTKWAALPHRSQTTGVLNQEYPDAIFPPTRVLAQPSQS